MSSYKITVTKIDSHPDAVTAPQITEVFSQTIESFDLPKFVVALNKKTRVRKSKS